MQTSGKLLAKYPIISDQVSREDLAVVLSELERVLQRGAQGDIVEFGCYIGTTSLFIRRLLDAAGASSQHSFHVYDSFAGLPEKKINDASLAGESFRAGQLAVSKRQFLQEFRRTGLRPPIVHKGWFRGLAAGDVPPDIAFAFLDGDFYDSILTSLRLVWPRMSHGGTVLIDDYAREVLPGVGRAVHDFFHGKLPPIRVASDIAIIKT